MWQKAVSKLSRFWLDQTGSVTAEYLILALLLGGIAVAVIAGLNSPLVQVHNRAIDTITAITGSGF